MKLFEPCSSELFFRSNKTGDPRLGELVQSDLKSTSQGPRVFLAGYPDDEGISLNGGRIGAAEAPDRIRRFFYKMTPNPERAWNYQWSDLGNLNTKNFSLSERHEHLKNKIKECLSEPQSLWIGLGGGHDYGYPDAAGFLLSLKDTAYKPLVINFDAHLDVRPTTQGLSSGTPFYRLLTDKSLPAFDFVEIGLQRQCNSSEHFQWLIQQGGHSVFLDEILLEKHGLMALLDRLSPFLLQPRPTFLSVDIDAFSSSFAPGCSQSWATGLVPNEFFPFLGVLLKRLDVRGLGIYEVSPTLDSDDRTSKLAAQILHHFLLSQQ